MSVCVVEIDRVDQIGLRQQARYWRSQHARAVEREAEWKAKAQQLAAESRQRDATIARLSQQVEALKARVAWLARQVFGRKTEATDDSTSDTQQENQNASASSPNATDELSNPSSEQPSKTSRKRGQQIGAKGHGRKRRVNLSCVEMTHELPEAMCRCPKCGKPFRVFPGTEDSEEIEWEVILRRRRHRRTRYLPTCDCRAVSGIVTAPCPPKLIPKGMFAISFWVRLLMEKFLLQRPLSRIRKLLALEGFPVSQGTLTGGLRRIAELLQPVYARILERSRAAKHWKMDETRWMVFEEVEGKKGYRWWLWVVITKDTVVYLLEPTRSAKVPKDHLGDHAEGIINADRYVVYKTLGDGILVAFCWSHVRRDFIRVRDGYRRLRDWGEAWRTRINELFRLNDQRLAVLSDPEAFQAKDRILRDAIDAMVDVRDRELADSNLQADHAVLAAVPADFTGRLAGMLRAGHLLGRQLQDGLDRGPTRHVDQLVDGHLRLRDQLQHGQEQLAFLAQELGQRPAAPSIRDLVCCFHSGSLHEKRTWNTLILPEHSGRREPPPTLSLQLRMGHPHANSGRLASAKVNKGQTRDCRVVDLGWQFEGDLVESLTAVLAA